MGIVKTIMKTNTEMINDASWLIVQLLSQTMSIVLQELMLKRNVKARMISLPVHFQRMTVYLKM